jgi:dolichyl-phosphate beta-glucosyltransferase
MNLGSRLKVFSTFFKYSVVGVSGTVLDLAVLFALVESAHLDVLFAATISFLAAVINNYTWNKLWTFKDKSKNIRKQFIKFLIVSIIGLLLTILFMYLFVNLLSVWYMFAKALTSVVVLTWNFLGNKYWTFQIKEREIPFYETFLYDLSVVIPAYNEENRIEKTLSDVFDYFNISKINAEVIVVSDGSIDRTAEIVNNFKKYKSNINLINLKTNFGKGYAVKQGIEKAKGRWVLFMDADNSTRISELDKLLKFIDKNDFVLGSRYLKESLIRIKQSRFRILLSRIGNYLIRLFLISGVRDSQCGFKLFKNNIAQQIFSRQKVNRFAFDMEVLVVAQSLGYSFKEVPIEWTNSKESRFRAIKDSFLTLKDLIYIKLNLWSGRYK